jgi:hypothetical protein
MPPAGSALPTQNPDPEDDNDDDTEYDLPTLRPQK